MPSVLAICALGVLCFALLAVLFLRERQHDSERAALLDRIASPQAAAAHAYQALAGVPPPLAEDTDAEDDARYGRDLTFDDDLSLDEQLDEAVI